ncbi:MEDS domain-containing protein [Caballeronia sp. NCTM1]|uniref:hybrid sensor histidine kinase/response regulator n=1 Tax=Caballeronia sp. NCTM1 TaxID=2921753 RepID=UPI0020287AFA|nr:MEDS domain-containing protein [Caballeronia sp. NCTM1]
MRHDQSTNAALEQTLRKSGIDAIGHAGWGTHFCHFYETRQDLIDMLVPYFEAGLRDNESCLWVAPDTIGVEEAETAMVEALPDFKDYVTRGQIAFKPASDWYYPDGMFRSDSVLAEWVRHERESRAHGFEGLRVTGDTFWLERTRWHDFADYEAHLNRTLGHYRIICVCSYSMDRCTASDVLDVCNTHQFALTRRKGVWQLVQSDSLAAARMELERTNAELEARVEARTRDLEVLLRERDEFLSMLSHELRNPLAPIESAIEVIRRSVPEQSPAAAASHIVARQVRNLSVILKDLLEADRTVRGMFAIDPVPVELAAVIKDAVDAIHPAVAQKGQTLATDGLDRSAIIVGDRVRLNQVFINLLHNATTYSPPLGHINVSMAVTDGEVRVCFSDDGPGVPEALRDRIFSLFVQGPRELDRSQGGFGIGLAVARQIVERHGGSLTLERARSGRWSRFIVTLPCTQDAPPVSPAPGHMPAPTQTASRRILIVDDEPDIVSALLTLLEMEGHDVRTAYDGETALRIAATFEPEVVLADIGMPRMDGYELARRLRSLPGTATSMIVAVSGYGTKADRERSGEAGFDAHLIKPVAPPTLLCLIDKATARNI